MKYIVRGANYDLNPIPGCDDDSKNWVEHSKGFRFSNRGYAESWANKYGGERCGVVVIDVED